MATRTLAQLMTQGGVAATNEEASDYVRQWMNSWLMRTAKSWSWPVLKLRMTKAVSAGASSVGVGAGIDGITYGVHRLLGNYVYWYTSDRRSKGKMLVRPLLDGDVSKDEDATLAAERLGSPTTCRVRVRVQNPADPDALGGQLVIYPDPVPNVAMTFAFDVHVIPAVIVDADVPWYPNDRTLEQAVKCAFMEQDDGAEGRASLQTELQRLGQMVVDDRDFDGEGPGDNQMMMLDPSVFR